MYSFTNPFISIATENDISALVTLLNSAYRGESSKAGWTTEAHLIAGDVRTNELTLKKVMQQPGSFFLKYTNDRNELTGCVNLQKHDNKLYLGMFSVSPGLQGGGIGKQLLKASEEFAGQVNCSVIYMTVISVRSDLIAWYERNGYRDTGERKPFPEDDLTGRHLQELEFMVMEKNLTS